MDYEEVNEALVLLKELFIVKPNSKPNESDPCEELPPFDDSNSSSERPSIDPCEPKPKENLLCWYCGKSIPTDSDTKHEHFSSDDSGSKRFDHQILSEYDLDGDGLVTEADFIKLNKEKGYTYAGLKHMLPSNLSLK